MAMLRIGSDWWIIPWDNRTNKSFFCHIGTFKPINGVRNYGSKFERHCQTIDHPNNESVERLNDQNGCCSQDNSIWVKHSCLVLIRNNTKTDLSPRSRIPPPTYPKIRKTSPAHAQ